MILWKICRISSRFYFLKFQNKKNYKIIFFDCFNNLTNFLILWLELFYFQKKYGHFYCIFLRQIRSHFCDSLMFYILYAILQYGKANVVLIETSFSSQKLCLKKDRFTWLQYSLSYSNIHFFEFPRMFET